MTPPIFVDTSYVFALFNERDQWHDTAMRLQKQLSNERHRLITTEFVLVEVGDGMSAVTLRERSASIISGLLTSELVDVVAASTDLLNRSLDLFSSRKDKSWGLTDCSSFVVMREHGVTNALTMDDHFRQAGFNILMHHPA